MSTDMSSLKQWIKNYLAVLIDEPIEKIDTNDPLSSFDMDSVDAVIMGTKLEEEFGITIHPEMFLDVAASIKELCERILQIDYSDSNHKEEKVS
ncbi:acyl carrier protein [Desulfovibrio inopinatus]|uniref:acyl carrier protein n=1 Tax=Desulfovibrio inopinatus TaxID=102109 RepID=UPI0003F594DA|nr:acyl carrier protein [Desulfovibrio inopinatus]